MSELIQEQLSIQTDGRELRDITGAIARVVKRAGVDRGLCHVFIRHTSASLLINENADPDVLRDLETFFSDLVVDGDQRFVHRAEGPDDMAAHVRCALTQTELSVPVVDGTLALGTWQGIFLWEHRHRPHCRRLVVTISGVSRP
ncbi:MAG: YjbQ family protein [Wenzhouxiangella sp.]|nr:MAG: YjbQ family protein [Wenzhouxiangella sp.]